MMLMNRTALTLTLILALSVSIMTGIQTLEIANAQYTPPPCIEIFSPIPPPDVNSNAFVMFNVRVNVLPSESDITFIRYSLDGKVNVTLANLTKEDNVWYWTTTEGVFAQGKAFSTEASLGNLADGIHTLSVYAHYADGKEMSKSIEFTVDTNYKPWNPPELVLLSPQNQSYTSVELQLTFATNETILSANYLLDNRGGNASQYLMGLMGNTTLTGLSNGIHKLTVTVWTERGLASQSTFFTVAQETENQQPFPRLMIITVALTGAVVVVGILVYFKKRKRAVCTKRVPSNYCCLFL
jgi:hypothetical protein